MDFLFGQDLGTITAIFLALCLFGIGYNALISWMSRRGYTEGYLSLIVAFGVMVTLGAVSILSIQAGMLALLMFAASGTPMIAGSIFRHMCDRENSQKALVNEVKDDKAA